MFLSFTELYNFKIFGLIFGLLIVSILAGAILVFTALGITYFMKSSIPVKESFLPINKWLELVFDKYTGRFLISTFTLMGVVIAFFISFVPQNVY